MGLKKVLKQGRDENTERLSCMLQKSRGKERLEDYSTDLIFVATEVVFQSCFTMTFLQQDSLLVFSSLPCFCTFFRPIPILALNFYRNFFTPSTTFSY